MLGREFLKQLDDLYFVLTKMMFLYIDHFCIYDLLVFCIVLVKVHY